MGQIKQQAIDAIAAVEHADLAVTQALADQRHRPAVRKAGWLSDAADQPPLVALSLAVIAVGLATRQRGVARTGMRMLAAHALATGIKTAIKRTIDRTRPDHALMIGYRMEPGDSDTHELSSFPSGHTAGAVAVAEAVAADAPALAAPMRLFAAAVGVVQVPRAKHNVSGVLVGAAIGGAAHRIVARAERRARAAMRQRRD